MDGWNRWSSQFSDPREGIVSIYSLMCGMLGNAS